jgi:hypothetical protein
MKKLLLILCIACAAGATNYYIDYDGGSDAANGTSTSSPWKHAPGDANATGNANMTPTTGDSLFLKGGVTYYGKITGNASGISYIGNKWGTGRAIVDASTIISGVWTKCASANECDTNPNYDSIWYIDLQDIPNAIEANLCEDDTMVWLSQSTTPDDPLFYALETDFFIPDAINTTGLRDGVLETIGGSSLPGAILFHYGQAGATATYSYSRVTSFVYPDSITYTALAGLPAQGASARYTLGNKARWIKKGNYAITENASGVCRCWIWPYSNNPNNSLITYTKTTGDYCMKIQAKQNVTVKNIIFQKSGGFTTGEGVGIYVQTSKNVLIDSCKSWHHRYGDYGGYGGFYFLTDTSLTLSHSSAAINQSHRGIYAASCYDITFENDTAFRVGQTSITFHTCKKGKIVSCVSRNCDGSHANAISVYLGCDTILLAYNKIDNKGCGIALQSGGNMTVYSNVVDGVGLAANLLVSWSSNLTGINRAINNTLVHSTSSHIGLDLSDTVTSDSIFVLNNITDGEDVKTGNYRGSHEAFIGLLWTQQKAYGFHPRIGDIIDSSGNTYVAETPDSCLIDYTGGDYSIDDTKLTYKTGADITSSLPTYWTGFNWNLDVDGNYRDITAPSIGAYEEAGAEPPAAGNTCSITIRRP